MKNSKTFLAVFLRPFRFIYFAWCAWWFLASFLVLFPFFWLFIQKKEWHPYTVFVDKIWCWFFFPIAFLRVKKQLDYHPEKGKAFIYCVNHASYLDIPVLTYVLTGFNAFMGKSAIAKVPLFGYMFKNLHITVNRRSAKDRARALQQSKDFLEAGRCLIFFPEGGIKHKHQPGLAPFKDGAFRLSMELNVPIIPVTLPYNWRILPDTNITQPGFGIIWAVIHQPIYPTDFVEGDVDGLKQEVFRIIEAELKKWNPDSFHENGNR